MEIESEKYLIEIKEKLNNVDDPELVRLVSKLIDERNYLATTICIDPLTGIYNRRIISRIRDVNTIVMIDIDDFKTINDNYGHDVGDVVIKNVASILINNSRIGDYVIRFGGDEFMILYPNIPSEVLQSRLKKISYDVSQLINLPGRMVTLSIGVAIDNDREPIDELFKKADMALYQSKENGKNQITYYNEEKKLIKQ